MQYNKMQVQIIARLFSQSLLSTLPCFLSIVSIIYQIFFFLQFLSFAGSHFIFFHYLTISSQSSCISAPCFCLMEAISSSYVFNSLCNFFLVRNLNLFVFPVPPSSSSSSFSLSHYFSPYHSAPYISLSLLIREKLGLID